MAYTKEGIQRKTSLKLDGGDDTEIVGGYADGLTAAQITSLNSIDPSQVQIPAGIAGIAPQIWYTELDDTTPIPYKKVGDKSIPPRLVVAKFVDAQQNTILTVPLDIVYTTRKGLYKGRILRSAKLGFINDDENRGKLSVDTLLDTYGLYSFGTKVYTGGISDEFGSFSKEKSNQHASFLGVTDNFAVSILTKASGEGYWAKTKHKDQT